ncbi:MAG TPA: MobF family relaxase [Rhodopila sp.]|nr:MobF family relaxase [Rhodopila sp.]
MLTYRTGAAGSRGVAKWMAEHLFEQTLSALQMALAQYYQHGLATPGLSEALASVAVAASASVLGEGDTSILSSVDHASGPGGLQPGLSSSDIVNRIAALPESALSGFAATRPVPRQDMRPRLASLLGLDRAQSLSTDQIAGILSGNRADGWPIDGKQVQRASESLATTLGLDPGIIPGPDAIDAILAGKRADGTELVGPKSQVASLRQRFLGLYGVRGPEVSPEGRAHIRAGCRADGRPIDPNELAQGLTASRAAIGYVDLCWSADKSVSVAWAFAPTEAERNIIAQAHRDAVDTAMRHVESEIGRARKGKAGRAGYESGTIGWIAFEHYASRPTVEIVRNDPATGEPRTEIVSLKVAGDPQLHTHVAVPNVVLTESGRIGALDLQRLEGRIHEWGGLYQAHLASNLRRAGIEVALDPERGSARIVAIPEAVRAAFSKRTEGGVEAARRYATDQGLDWDQLSPDQKIGLAKQGVQGNPRQAKQDDLSDWASWHRQADAVGWQPTSIIRPDQAAASAGLATDLTSVAGAEHVAEVADERIEIAYEAALDLLERDLGRRAVLDESVARAAAARGLIASGIEDARDIDAVMGMLLARGARQDGEMVGLIRREAEPASRRPAQLTTTLHVSREAELIDLARIAGADRRGALDSVVLETAISQAAADFAGTAHGRAQRAMIERLGTGGRLGVGIGVAGSGKSTLLAPLVAAWQAEGYRVYGAALAWRQSDDLAGTGIAEPDRAALSVFLDRAQRGEVRLDARSVVVVDELGLLGTRQLLDLLRLQAASGCRIVAIGDEKQCQSIEAGPVIDLLRRALGPEAVPELLSSVRQESERERETALLFREGQAGPALGRLREAERAVLVPGGYQEAVEAVADLWQRLRTAQGHEPGYTVTVSTPSNDDARAIAGAIRERRRAAGEIGPDQAVVPACDHAGHDYDLRLAPGDRVRLFARTNGRYPDRSRGIIGNNGSVLEVTKLDADGVTLRNAQGREGLVLWNTLRAPGSGRVRLAYGDVLTIDAAQGVTSTAHILALPAGSRTVTGFKAYTGASRHRAENHLVFSEGAERREVMGRRPLGDTRAIGTAELWENVARNLSRQPTQESATAFMERAHQVNRAASRALQAGFSVAEQRAVEGKEPTTLTTTWRHLRMVAKASEIATVTKETMIAQNAGLMDLAHAVRRAIDASLQVVLPVIRRAIDAFAHHPEQVARREELAELRNDWVQRQMDEWRATDRAEHPMPVYYEGADWQRAVRAREDRTAVAETAFRKEAKQVSSGELRAFEAERQRVEDELRLSSGPTSGAEMGM